jgi:molybdenum cofactor synthesis domain-containing protein
VRIGILTVSDLGAQGRRDDTSGDTIAAWASKRGFEVAVRSVVPDETNLIVSKLTRWSDSGEVDVVLTTGGTGLAQRDVTPDATRAAVEREAQGISEAIRARGAKGTSRAWLSRAIAGTRGRTLIVNLAGSPGAVRDALPVLDELLEHAVNVLRGDPAGH